MTTTLTQSISRFISVIVIITSQGHDPRKNLSQNENIIFYPARVPYGGDSAIKALLGWFYGLVPAIRNLKVLVRQKNIRLMHLHFATYHLSYYTMLSKIAGIPYIVTLHGSDVTQFSSSHYLNRLLVRFILRNADKIIAVSNALATDAGNIWPEISTRLVVIHNGADIPEILPDKNSSPPYEGGNEYFVCIGNLVHVKAFDMAIKCWSILKKNYSTPPHLLIIGGGDQAEYYKQLIKQHELGELVQLTGALPREQALAYLDGALGLLVPSRSEGLPYIILEAGLLNKPVIASRVGGIVEIIEQGKHGLLVDAENPGAIVDAVRKLLDNPKLACSVADNLHQRVLKTFTTEVMVHKYFELYRQVMK